MADTVDIFAAGLRITVDGKEPTAPAVQTVTEVVTKTHVKLAGSFSIRLMSKLDAVLAKDCFPFGAAVEISLGDGDGLKQVMEGEVTSLSAEYTGAGPSVVVRGLDRSHRLRRGGSYRAFPETSDARLASDQAKARSLSARTDTTSPDYPALLQMGVSGHRLLEHRAGRLGFRYRTEGSELAFQLPTYESSGLTLDNNKDILLFDFLMELSGLPSEVVVSGWDATKKEWFSEKAAAGDEIWPAGSRKSGLKISQQAFGDASLRISDESPRDTKEAQTIARGTLQARSEQFFTGPLTLIGKPGMEVGKLVEVTSLGEFLNGAYLVQGVTHVFSAGGFYTRLELSRNAL